MKLSKGEALILSVAALFLAFTAGWFLRGNTSPDPIRIETGRTAGPAAANISLSETAPVPAPSEEAVPPSAPAPGERINIHTADAALLETRPGIGEKRAASIIADREANGPFRFPEDITRVKGIGEEILAGLIDLITTEDTP